MKTALIIGGIFAVLFVVFWIGLAKLGKKEDQAREEALRKEIAERKP